MGRQFGRGTSVIAVLVACGLAGCPRVPAPGEGADRDAGPDAAREAGPHDGAIDSGPPPARVIPAQAWEVVLRYTRFGAPASIRATVLIDARGESGSARAVIGANGLANSIVLEVESPGRLVHRDPVDLAVAVPAPDCAEPVVRLRRMILSFRDADADGVLEELTNVTAAVSLLNGVGGEAVLGDAASFSVERDTTAPTLTRVPAHPIGGFETLQLFGTEPLVPSAVPYLEGGGRTFPFRETDRSGASHWWVDLASLPSATGYVLRFSDDIRDVAGNAAIEIPSVTFDVPDHEPLRLDGFESGLFGIAAEDGARLLSGGEVPLAGLTSAFATSRAVLAVVPFSTATTISIQFRLHASTLRGSSSVWFRARSADGRTVAATGTEVGVFLEGTVSGLAFQSDSLLSTLAIPRGSGPLSIEIDPRGSTDPTCGGSPRVPDGEPIGITIDGVTLR